MESFFSLQEECFYGRLGRAKFVECGRRGKTKFLENLRPRSDVWTLKRFNIYTWASV